MSKEEARGEKEEARRKAVGSAF